MDTSKVPWPAWVERTKEQAMKRLVEQAETPPGYFGVFTLRSFLRASGKGSSAEFIMTLLEKDGLIERLNPTITRTAALWKLTEAGKPGATECSVCRGVHPSDERHPCE